MPPVLKPLFDAAARELATTGWKDLHQRTAYASPTLILRPPRIDAKVLTDVQHAIAHGVQFAARYRSKGKAPGTDVRAHPLGMPPFPINDASSSPGRIRLMSPKMGLE